jgi:hypothetical protein
MERTPDGHPDFQGVWANNTVTPLQRPKQWEGKTRLTDAEVADLQKFAAQIVENDGDAQFGDGFILAVLNRVANPKSYDPGTGNYNQFWVVERDWHDRRTSLITDPPDGKLPAMTPDAQKRRAAEIEYRKAHASRIRKCSRGRALRELRRPRLQAGGLQQLLPDRAVARLRHHPERDGARCPHHSARWPPTLDSSIRIWNGDPRGRWEGDTLVIETTNFSPKSDFMGSHENLRLTEKFTRAGREILNYAITINDPTTWTAPWTAMIPLKLKNELIYEYACHEGNEAIPNMLRGHRFEERGRA